MSSRCSSSTCLNGNCQGCRNGSKFCNDPRCFPNCPDCTGETSINCVNKRDGWDWGLIIIITALAIFLLLLAAWGWYNSSTTNKIAKESMGQNPYYYPYQYHQYPAEYYQGTYEQAPPAAANPHHRAIDASLDVNIQATDDIPIANIIPDIPPARIDGTPSVASAQAPAIPSRPASVSASKIRGPQDW